MKLSSAMKDMKSTAPVSMATMPDMTTEGKEEYPYGLRISLGKAELDKLGIDPKAMRLDADVNLSALACVKCIEEDRVVFQIEQMLVESSEEED